MTTFKSIRLDSYANMDANESGFFNRQLEYIEPTVYKTQFPTLKARQHFPSFAAGAGLEAIGYREQTAHGRAKIIGSKVDDLPRVDITGAESFQAVRHLGDSYGYDYFEIEKAMRAGLSLDAERATAAREAIEREIDLIAYFGDAASGLPGLFTNTAIPSALVEADGTGSSTAFADKTPDQIIRDMNNLANGILVTTNGVEQPNALLMPVDQYTYIASTPRSSTSDTTILQYFLLNNPHITSVDWSIHLKNVAAKSNRNVMVAYRKDPGTVKLHIPREFRQLQVQVKGLEYIVPCVADIAGLIVYKPKAFAIGEGI
jgi:hypothetical protein